MKKVIILVIVLVVLGAIAGGLLYADMHVKEMVEEHAEVKLTEALPQVTGVHVSIDGFPFVPGVLISGEVEALHVKVDVAEEQGLRATDLTLDVEHIALDTDAMLDEERLVVTDIGSATAQAFVTQEAVSKVAKHEVEFEPGKARVEYQGQTVEANASVRGRMVMLSTNLEGVPPMLVPLPPSEMIPCSPEVELLDKKVRLACSVDEIPPKLKDAIAAK